MAQIALNYSAAQINAAIAKINSLVSVIEGSIVQLYDGSTAIYPRTKAEAVFFDNDPSKTLDQQFSQLEQEIEETNEKIICSTGIIDNGTTYNEKDSVTQRVCVYYEIPNLNANYKIKVSNVNLSDISNSIIINIRSGKTPYSATNLLSIGSVSNNNEVEYLFNIPSNIRESAKYISVTQNSAEGTASFNVELSYDGSILENKINQYKDNIITLDTYGNGMDYSKGILSFQTIPGNKYIIAKPKEWTVNSITHDTDAVFAIRRVIEGGYSNIKVWEKSQFNSILNFTEFIADTEESQIFVRGDVGQHLLFYIYNIGGIKEINDIKDEILKLNQQVFYLDNGTTYNEKFILENGTITNRTCVFYPIKPTENDIFEIKVDNTIIPSGTIIQISTTKDKSPYSAAQVYNIDTIEVSGESLETKFSIPSQYIENSKYIAVFQNVADENLCQFDVTLLLYNSIIKEIEKINDELGIIDNGTTYDEKFITDGGSITNRTCVFYPIENIDDLYRIVVSNTIIPNNNRIMICITKARTPWSTNPPGNLLQLVGELNNTGESFDNEFSINSSIASDAKYIGVFQETADASLCSFKIQLFYKNGIKNEIYVIDKEIKNIPGISNDIIPYNDSIFVEGRTVKVYNPYKKGGSNQYAGQLHCHSWNYETYNGVTYKVPLGYTVEQVAAMTEEERNELVLSVNQQFVQAHKTVGYSFMTITNYDNFADFTLAPAQMPNDFIWLGNGFEGNVGGWDSTAQSEDQGAHMNVINTNFGKRFAGWTRQELLNYCEDRNCIVTYNHPFLNMIYSSPAYVKQIKKRLRFIEVYNGLGVLHADVGNIPYIKPGIMLDEDFDALISQGNFTFALGVSDQRTLNTSTAALRQGCIKVFADSLTHKNIVDALLDGNFYASSYLDDSLQLNSIIISENQYIIDTNITGVTVEFIGKNNVILKTVTTTSENKIASYDIKGTEGIVRARLYKLNSNPYDADFWYKNKEWIMWTQPLFMANEIL